MKTTLQLKFGQQLNITPQLQQAIELLVLPSCELSLYMQRILESNPMIELCDSSENEFICDSEENEVIKEDTYSKDDPYSEVAYSFNRPTINKEVGSDPKLSLTLKDHLYWQMDLTPFSEKDAIIATYLIDEINESGFLESPLEEIQQSLYSALLESVTLSEIEAVLHRIQQFEPTGVGSRNLKEFLLIQLNRLPKDTVWLDEAKQIVNHYSHLIGKGKFLYLKNKLNLSDNDFKAIMKVLSGLYPSPNLSRFLPLNQSYEKSDYTLPDLIIKKKNGQFVVQLNMSLIPRIKIQSNTIEEVSAPNNRAHTPHDKLFIQDSIKEARWLINALEHRHASLYKVGQCIVEEQKAFFENGLTALVPLNYKTVAEKTGLDESTVSRIVAQKTILSPQGMFELKYFFSNGLSTTTGEQCTPKTVQAMIRQLIAAEELHHPLSDHAIAQILLEQGIHANRRTVTKYRIALSIPSSYVRKGVSHGNPNNRSKS